MERSFPVMESTGGIGVSRRQKTFLERLQGCELFIQLECFNGVGIAEAAVFTRADGVQTFFAQDSHQQHSRIKMQRPFVFSADRDWSNACRLYFFYGRNKIIPLMNLSRINAGFRTEFFVIPENDRSDIVRQTIDLAIDAEVLDAGCVKSVGESIALDCLRDILPHS